MLIATLIAFLFLMLALGFETLLLTGRIGDPRRGRGCGSCDPHGQPGGCGCSAPVREEP